MGEAESFMGGMYSSCSQFTRYLRDFCHYPIFHYKTYDIFLSCLLPKLKREFIAERLLRSGNTSSQGSCRVMGRGIIILGNSQSGKKKGSSGELVLSHCTAITDQRLTFSLPNFHRTLPVCSQGKVISLGRFLYYRQNTMKQSM